MSICPVFKEAILEIASEYTAKIPQLPSDLYGAWGIGVTVDLIGDNRSPKPISFVII